MDLRTITGLVGGFGAIAWAMLLRGGVMPFVDGPSFIVVFGNTLACCFAHHERGPVEAAKASAVPAIDRPAPRVD